MFNVIIEFIYIKHSSYYGTVNKCVNHERWPLIELLALPFFEVDKSLFFSKLITTCSDVDGLELDIDFAE